MFAAAYSAMVSVALHLLLGPSYSTYVGNMCALHRECIFLGEISVLISYNF